MSTAKKSAATRSKAKKGTSAAVEAGGVERPDGPGNVEQIRDILFGNQMRDYDRRFQRLEEGIRKEVADLRSDTKSQLEALEEHLRKEMADVRAALTRESKDRMDADRKLGDDLKRTADETYERIRELESDLDSRAAELRDQILAQSKALSEDIQARDDRLSSELSEAAAELQTSKVDRGTLAQLLVEVAMRISGEVAEDGSD